MSKLHKCVQPHPYDGGGNGPAVTECSEDKDGFLWVDNGEYGNHVNFCPFCGYKSKKCIENHRTSINHMDNALKYFDLALKHYGLVNHSSEQTMTKEDVPC